MKNRFISEEQARAALEQAVAEGRITLTPEEEVTLRTPDGEWRSVGKERPLVLKLLWKFFRPQIWHS